MNGFFTMDRQWTVQYWNKAAEKLLGVKAQDIVGKNLWEKFAGIIPVEFYNVYPKAFLLDVPFHFEEYWGEMGTWFDVIVYHCDDTLSVSFKSCNQFSSENVEERLKTENELYWFITEVSNDSMWEWNMRTNEIFWIDGGHKKNFGYDIENAFIPRNFWESRIHPDDKENVLARLAAVIATGADDDWTEDYRFQRVDGTYAYVRDRGFIIYDEHTGASRMIGTTLDVTAEKLNGIKLLEAEKKISAMEAASNILQKDRNSALAQNANFAHDLRNSVGNIKLSIEMLGPAVKGNDVKVLLDVIMRCSVRIGYLIDEITKPS